MIIAARTGFTPDPIAMNAAIGAISTGGEAMVMAGIGQKAVDITGIGVRAIATVDTGRVATVTAAIGRSLDIIAITPGPRRGITAMGDITTGTRHTTA